MKNIDFVIKKTAKELGQPEDQVRKVLMEYWKTGMSNIFSLEKTTVSFRHIGSFTVSRYKLYNYLKKQIGKIRRMKTLDTVSEEKRAEILKIYHEDLRTALVQRNILAIHYQKRFKKDGNSERLHEGGKKRHQKRR